MVIKHVFVYGTLMTGLENHWVIKPYLNSCQTAKMKGLLYHLPYGYPAMGFGDRDVIGEVVELLEQEQALVELDQLEDYFGAGDPSNLYNRVVQEAELINGQRVAAYVYLWAKPSELPKLGLQVTSGNWREYLCGDN